MKLIMAIDPALDPSAIPIKSALRLPTSRLVMRAILARGKAITSASLSLVRYRVGMSLLCLHLNGTCSCRHLCSHS